MILTPMFHALLANMYLSDSVLRFRCLPLEFYPLLCNRQQTERVVLVLTLYACIGEIFVCSVEEVICCRE
jgi:hypothetical protein